MTDLSHSNLISRQPQPQSATSGLGGLGMSAANTENMPRRRNVEFEEGGSPTTKNVNEAVMDLLHRQGVIGEGGTLNEEAAKNLTEDQKKHLEKLEEEERTRQAKREQELARQLIQIVRSDYISEVDLTTMQSKYLVNNYTEPITDISSNRNHC